MKERRFNRSVCGTGCRKEMDRKGYAELNPPMGLSTSCIGATAELCVCADLLLKGYEVFRAVQAAAQCDLAILKNGTLYRVEIKTKRYGRCGTVSFNIPAKQIPMHDVLAVWIPTTKEIIYKGLPE
jgi:PD-(D/E)XK endonuclease